MRRRSLSPDRKRNLKKQPRPSVLSRKFRTSSWAIMDDTLARALVVLAPVSVLLSGAVVSFAKKKGLWPFVQLLGAGCLMIVPLTHVCEGLGLMPWMGWGRPDSVGHYLDLSSVALGFMFFPIGYLLDALAKHQNK